MASVEFATILALGAALLAGIGYVTLQRSARQVTAEEYVGHFTLFHLSLRHALWWLGSLAAVASFTLQAIALTMGSVVLVQSLVVLCVVGARIASGSLSAVLLAVASSATLAVFTVLTKGVVTELGEGFATLIRTPELYAWILVLPIGLMLQQSSLRVGALTASLPTITVARPVIASVLGITVLDEVLHTGRVALVALVAAVVVVVVATVALARDEVAMMTVSAGELGAAGQLAVR